MYSNAVQKGDGSAVAPWPVRLAPDRAVQACALARDIVLCSWQDT